MPRILGVSALNVVFHLISSVKSTVTLMRGLVVKSLLGPKIEFQQELLLDIASAGFIDFIESSKHTKERGSTKKLARGSCWKQLPRSSRWRTHFTENLEDIEMPAAANISHDSDPERPVKWTRNVAVASIACLPLVVPPTWAQSFDLGSPDHSAEHP